MASNNGRSIFQLFQADKFIGDVVIHSQTRQLPFKPSQELRISSISPASDRCTPLVALHTLSNDGVMFKLEPLAILGSTKSTKLELMHSACMKERKTAVIVLEGGNEVHLVAMNDIRNQQPCFWGFLMAMQVYTSCLTMLNLRTLALVFDLDETLIVANTLRSFEVKIEALGSRMKAEPDPGKRSGMASELKRYMQDRVLLKQFVDDNCVWDNAMDNYVTAQVELVQPFTEDGDFIMRPVIRLQGRCMIFTRIDPKIPDTSVLVRLRPAWEELRTYLTAKGRRRFEVFVCTMAEREYAYEMWRLLDPDGQLISCKQVVERITCVKSGSKKSLLNVFSRGNCHPRMTMVIDDRLDVWESMDQPNVHVVPAFSPYYAPQAEMNCIPPILCVARNIVCTVRGNFFRDLDEVLMKAMADVDFSKDVSALPQPPIISNYLMAEEAIPPPVEAADSTKHLLDDGGSDAGTKQMLTQDAVRNPSASARDDGVKSVVHPQAQRNNPNVLREVEHQPIKEPEVSNLQKRTVNLTSRSMVMLGNSKWTQSSTGGFVSESNLDTPRRWLNSHEGHDAQKAHGSFAASPFSSSSLLLSGAFTQNDLFADILPEDAGPRRLLEDIKEPEISALSKGQVSMSSLFGGSKLLSVEGRALGANARADQVNLGPLSNPVGMVSVDPISCLQEMSLKYNIKLEFKSELNAKKDLEFSVVIFCDGEYGGKGVGRTRKEAKNKAADNALKFLRGKMMSQQPTSLPGKQGWLGGSYSCEESYVPSRMSRDPRFNSSGLGPYAVNDVPYSSWGFDKPVGLPDISGPIAALKEFCMMERVALAFRDLSMRSPYTHPTMEFACQVEVGGRIVGMGRGWSWEEAKQRAAEDALDHFRAAIPHPLPLPHRSLRSPPLNKRSRTQF